MKLGVPWRVKGIRADTRETAREAARRAGLSLGEWLNTVILETAEDEGVRPSRRGYPADEDDADEFFAVHERLDDLGRQIDRLYRSPSRAASRASQPPASAGPEAYAPPSYQHRENNNHDGTNQLAQAIAQLNRRMDELVEVSRAAAAAPAQRQQPYAPPAAYTAAPNHAAPPADSWSQDIEQAMAEIAARQEALDTDPEAPVAHPQRSAAPEPLYEPPPAMHYAAAPQPEQHYQPEPYYPAPPQPAPAPAPAPMPTQNLAGLEQQLRHITGQIEALRQQPQLEQGIAELRQTLSDIARTLLDAMPRRAIEALENEVRQLAARLDNTRQAGVDTDTLVSVERGLAEVHGTLQMLRPAENLDGFREAVHNLAQKVDMLGASGPDMNAFHQLESAISALRGIVSHVASNEALEQLAGEVHALGEKIDYVVEQAANSSTTAQNNALEILDQRIAHIADALESRVQNGGSVPPQLEAVIQGLTDKIERLQHSRTEDPDFTDLEARVAHLVEKLDASGARFSQLEAIERGLADLISYLERNQQAVAMAPAAMPQMDGLQRDMMRTQSSLEAVHGTLGHVVDRLAMLESDMREARHQPPVQPPFFQPQPEAPQPAPHDLPQPEPAFAHERPEPRVFASAQQWQQEPAPEPQMPPAAQIEMPAPPAPQPAHAEPPASAPLAPPPSRESAHAQAAAAMARANPRPARPPIDPNLPPDEPLEPGLGAGRGRFGSSADRIAASEAALGRARPPADAGSTSNFIAAARRAARAAAAEPTTADLRAAARGDQAGYTSGKSFAQRMRKLFVGTSVIVLVGGALSIAANVLMPTDASQQQPQTQTSSVPEPATTGDKSSQPDTAALPTLPGVDSPASPSGDITGSIPNAAPPIYALSPSLNLPTQPAPTQPAVPSAQPGPTADKLPAGIAGPSLRQAAAAGDPAAEYELGVRYAEGHGVTANTAEAARWFDAAARQGLAMAQFRLAGFYEKGIGVKKDIDTARRLYRSAADQGNAKAMHNLAVLYAEGAAVKPDYKTAAQWFRLAADHGVADSQYNLAILYARGIGVDQDLSESYKWFALAANQGDADAGRKRDEVGKRLDPQALAAAKMAVKAFVPQTQPDAATSVKLPPGGWDSASSDPAPGPAKPKRNAPVRVGSR